MEENFRGFDPYIEKQALAWRGMAIDTSEWQPHILNPSSSERIKRIPKLNTCKVVARRNQICFVKRPTSSTTTLGLAKEKIAADLGLDLKIPIAPGCLWQPPQAEISELWYISLVPFCLRGGNRLDIFTLTYGFKAGQQMWQLDRYDRITDSIAQRTAKQNTALLMFHGWIGDVNQHNYETNMQVTLQDWRRYGPRLAAHDHANAQLRYDDELRDSSIDKFLNTGPLAEGLSKRDPRPYIDLETAQAVLQRIMDYPHSKIEEIVWRIPSSLITNLQKRQFCKDLIKSKELLADAAVKFLRGHGLSVPPTYRIRPTRNVTGNPLVKIGRRLGLI